MRRLAAILALTMSVAACTSEGGEESTTSTGAMETSSSTTTTSTTTTTAEPPDGFGGELVVGLEPFFDMTLNPFAVGSTSVRTMGNAVWATVYDIVPETWDRVPDAVSVLPTRGGSVEVAEDGTMTVRYEVRTGAAWSDGTPITGEDIAFTAETMRDLAAAGEGNVDPIMATVVDTDAVDRLAFITFAEPNLAFEDALWIILPRHTLDGVDLVAGSDGSDWPSGGPFVVDDYDPPDRVRFVRNDRYWKADEEGRPLPHLDAVTMVAANDTADAPSSTATGLRDRTFDVAAISPFPDHLSIAAAAVDEGAELATTPTAVIEHLTFQFGDGREARNDASPNDSLDVRRAVAHAIDRTGLLDETGVPWSADVSGMLIPGGGTSWDRYAFDPAEGRALVDAAGLEDPGSVLSTTGNGDYRIRIGDALVAAFGRIGVDYATDYQDSVVFFGETFAEGTFDIGLWAWLSDGGYASQLFLLEQFDPAAEVPAGNVGRWGVGATANDATERFSEIVEEARSTADPQRFTDLVAEAEEILAEQVPMIPLFRRAAHSAWWPDTASGIVPNGSISDLTWNLELWQRVGE